MLLLVVQAAAGFVNAVEFVVGLAINKNEKIMGDNILGEQSYRSGFDI